MFLFDLLALVKLTDILLYGIGGLFGIGLLFVAVIWYINSGVTIKGMVIAAALPVLVYWLIETGVIELA